MAWLLAQRPWIVPIPGTTKIERLRQNVAASEVTLTDDDLREIEEASVKIRIQGDRYPPELEARTGLYARSGGGFRGTRSPFGTQPLSNCRAMTIRWTWLVPS